MVDEMKEIFIYRVDSEDRMVYVNTAWLKFASANDTPLSSEEVIGQSLWSFVTGVETRHLYELILAKVRKENEAVRLPFRCDSPDCRRFMSMNILPVRPQSVEFRTKIVKLEYRTPVPLLSLQNKRSNDFLSICSWCKKIPISETEWVEVEYAVQHFGLFEKEFFPQLTHGICPECEKLISQDFL